MVRIYPPPDDSADEIARDLRAQLSWDPVSDNDARELELAIAAALRAYGASQRNAGLEEAILSAAEFLPHCDGDGELWVVRKIMDRIASLKDPESKP